MIGNQPDARGYFGEFGGRFVPETVMGAVKQLEHAYRSAKTDSGFSEELDRYLREYIGRPSPLYYARRLSTEAGGARIYLKREDLIHTGAHKINNTVGQVLLAKRMGKERIVAETGAGQHGVATAAACALCGMVCTVYMGTEDIDRQRSNVLRMKLLNAEVRPVNTGSRTLKDAINEALRDWVTNVRTTHYCIGSVVGPHPYPMMVRDFQSVIGREARAQILETEGRLPDMLIACVGGGSNAMGLFYPFINNEVALVGVEGGGFGLDTGKHAATLTSGSTGVLHGSMSYVLQDRNGQVLPTHSLAAGLDYPGVGPEHSFLKDCGRISYVNVTDREAREAFHQLSAIEGIIPALESAHAVAYTTRIAQELGPEDIVVVNLSGRGDKDLNMIEETLV